MAIEAITTPTADYRYESTYGKYSVMLLWTLRRTERHVVDIRTEETTARFVHYGFSGWFRKLLGLGGETYIWQCERSSFESEYEFLKATFLIPEEG